jgi:hypothetical protein
MQTEGKRKARSPVSILFMIPACLGRKTIPQNSLNLNIAPRSRCDQYDANLTVFMPKMTANNLILTIHLFQRPGTFTGTRLNFLDI